MADKPILFTGWSMQRILADAKTQTRRCHAKARYAVGDHLWCRETWRTSEPYDPYSPSQIDSGAAVQWRADGSSRLNGPENWGRWRPSIFMPKWATRQWLEVTEVRQERLQEISVEDIIAEGYEEDTSEMLPHLPGPRYWFLKLWERLNGKKPGWAWWDNPMIYAYTFKRIERTPRP